MMARFTVKVRRPIRDILRRRTLEEMPHTNRMLQRWGINAAHFWRELVRERGGNQPNWWRENYLGPNGSRIGWHLGPGPRSVTVFHNDADSRYNFESVIERGRPPYDLKQMLGTSGKVRRVLQGRRAGIRYMIIPMRQTGDAPPADFRMVKTEEERRVSRLGNKYRYDRFGRGNVAQFRQITRRGTVQTSQASMVTMSEDRPGGPSNWIYPAIPGIPYSQIAHRAVINGEMRIPVDGRRMNFQESLRHAILLDLSSS